MSLNNQKTNEMEKLRKEILSLSKKNKTLTQERNIFRKGMDRYSKKNKILRKENTNIKETIKKAISKTHNLWTVYYEDNGEQQQTIFGFDLYDLISDVDIPIHEKCKLDGIQLHWRHSIGKVCLCGEIDCAYENDTEEERIFPKYTLSETDTLLEKNLKVLALCNDLDIDYFGVTLNENEHKIDQIFEVIFKDMEKFI